MNKKYPIYPELLPHKELLENYEKTRSCRDASSPEMRELAALREKVTGIPPNMNCNTCIDEMIMDLVHYYKHGKEEAATLTKATGQQAQAKTQNQGQGNKNAGQKK